MNRERTWKDVVTDALIKLGGQGSLKEITEIALKDPKGKKNTKVREKVRQVVRAYKIFETEVEGSGVYRLADEPSLIKVNQAATTKDVTDEIQGKLLYIGRANNFETFAPSDDCTKRSFGGEPLAQLATVRDILDVPRLNQDEQKKIARIDVLWLEEEDAELRPRYAFEIENSTKVVAGLARLSVIPRLFQTRLFVVGEDDRQKKRFDDHLSAPAFKPRANSFRFKYFDEIRELFKFADAYAQARANNEAAMRNLGIYD